MRWPKQLERDKQVLELKTVSLHIIIGPDLPKVINILLVNRQRLSEQTLTK